jgi:hypothetical protein
MVQLFNILQKQTTETSLAARIIGTTAQLMNKSVIITATLPQDHRDLMTEISQFCSTFPPGRESLQILVSAAMLARIDDPRHLENMEIKGQNSEWIFSALEYVQQLWEESPNAHQGTEEWDSTTTLTVRSLLQFLACSAPDSLPLQPPLRSLHIILLALSAPGDISKMATQVLYRAPRNWFLDPNSQPVMQENSVWSQLGHLTLKYLHPIDLMGYLRLGGDIAKIAEWKPIIYEDLATWITAFIHCTDRSPDDLNSATFVSVIRSVWVPEFSDRMQLLNEMNESWILALTALASVWNGFQFSSMNALACLRLARCTVTTSLCVHYFYWDTRKSGVTTLYTRKPIPRDIRVFPTARGSPPPGSSKYEEHTH